MNPLNTAQCCRDLARAPNASSLKLIGFYDLASQLQKRYCRNLNHAQNCLPFQSFRVDRDRCAEFNGFYFQLFPLAYNFFTDNVFPTQITYQRDQLSKI